MNPQFIGLQQPNTPYPSAAMSSATASDRVDLDQSTSLADQLRQKHTVTIEDAEDPDLPVPTLKQKSEYGQSKSLDTKSHELFPELGGPKKANSGVAPIWNAKGPTDGNNVHGGNCANGGSETSKSGPPSLSIPGRNVAHVLLEPQQVMPRSQLKRPIPDILKDLNRKSRANVSMVTAPNGRLRFEATGPSDVANQALRDLVQQIGAKVSYWTRASLSLAFSWKASWDNSNQNMLFFFPSKL